MSAWSKNTCFACGRPLRGKIYRADTRDDQTVYVGPDCYQHIKDAGESGYQPPLGGPKLYPLPDGPFVPSAAERARA